ncbi:helix-turn-helix transcriptional regulator [Undibacterium sp. SXout20W]|uniref:helix-turn-helix transcriptional regulator n=1 Tax=Undibacterium sp. SXout20W TaxID=3413051 RepID=UPI003BF1C65A
MQTQSPARLLRLPSVLQKVPLSKTEWYRRIKAGDAPKAVSLGARSVAWLESDIEQYIQKLAQESAK